MSTSPTTTDDQSPAIVEVTIERILPGGVGLAHAEGRTIFVALSAPGDVLRVQIDRVRGKVAFASIVEIVKPSPARVEPPCPYFGRCGGCDFQQLNYQAQLDAKVEMIRDCLRRIAHVEPPEISIVPSPQQWKYRGRANWQFDSRQKALGYFERGSHQVCDVAECAVLDPRLHDVFIALRGRVESLPDDLRELEAAVGSEGVSLFPPLTGFSNQGISRKIGDETYQFDGRSFFQINNELLEPLIEAALGDAHGESAIDLYCGVGLFTLPLARRFARVVGVESNTTATKFARRNLREAELQNAKIVTERVDDWLRHESRSAIDFLLLDPPRAGVEDGVIGRLCDLRPKRISYVSCDPATLARDLKPLLECGYSLDSMAAFDMFPQTHHVETVVHLKERK